MKYLNKTKIVATVGPASASREAMTALIKAGVNVFRLNFSHSNHEDHAKVIQQINDLNRELGTHIGILADLQGPKIRLGLVENDAVTIASGDIITVIGKEKIDKSELSTKDKFYISYANLASDVNIGDRILIDDGKIALSVVGTDNNEVQAKVIYGGVVKPKKGANLPDTTISMPSLTVKDREDLDFILTQSVQWIALSFVRSAEEIIKLKGMIEFGNHHAKVIAKIEKPEALKDIDNIIKVSDAVMVARGDLGVEVPVEQIPIIQKKIVKKCMAASKPVIIATQMMESMIENASPMRAEVTDVATAIFDGADALMLSGETATGKYPVQVIEMFMKVIRLVENDHQLTSRVHELDPQADTFLADAICYNAVKIAEQISAETIVAMTKSGYTALNLASHRPKATICMFTEAKYLLPTMSLVWGVYPFHFDKMLSTDESIRYMQQILKDQGWLKTGDNVVSTGSMPLNQLGKTNMIKVNVVK